MATGAPPAAGPFGLVVISRAAGRALLEPPRPRDGARRARLRRRRALRTRDGQGRRHLRCRRVGRAAEASLPRHRRRCSTTRRSVPRVQRGRIGVVGHSNGGYTALAVAGAPPNRRGPSSRTAGSYPDDTRFCSSGWCRHPSRPPASAGPASRMSVILVCAPSCSWRRIPPPSPTTRSHRWPFAVRV